MAFLKGERGRGAEYERDLAKQRSEESLMARSIGGEEAASNARVHMAK